MEVRTLEKRYDQVVQEVWFLRDRCRHLEMELHACRPELYRAGQKIDRLQQRVEKLSAENKVLKGKLADLTEKLKAKPKTAPPAWAKANVAAKRRGQPGRKKGHPAALRAMPEKIDVHETVALPVDAMGQVCCPECRSPLNNVEEHQRYVEELIPSQVLTSCYHTTSGWCGLLLQTRGVAGREPAAGGGPAARATGPERLEHGDGDAGLLSPAAAADHAAV